jgi:hypothetical protein
MLLGIYLYFEVFSLLAAIFFYTQKRNKIPLYFIPFLCITVIVELIGRVWATQIGFVKYAMYNIFTSLEFIFYVFLFYLQFRKSIFRRLALLFIPLFILMVLLNFIFIQGINETFNTYTFLFGSFFIVIFCCCFFYEAVLPDQIDEQLSKHPFFWICSGLLIYYLGSVIINALFEYLTSNDLREEGKKIYVNINNILNVILYSSFCIAFYLCPDNKKTYSSQS